ncbi:hypothetical protein PDESU_00222 [Pontiella desulfatans]|uniref:Uncharacterized protein n=1 Tax=Pontiella desulfatans TaxID=2750659 RepID=A0A6C2TVU3_PONDE|nr:hypothetical protein PDESU_00222 [Pontiella desulfatans]
MPLAFGKEQASATLGNGLDATVPLVVNLAKHTTGQGFRPHIVRHAFEKGKKD